MSAAGLDPGLVGRLVARRFPRWAGLPVVTEVRSTGTDNAIFRLGDDLAVRLPRSRRAAAALDREYRWLPLLAPRLPLAVPVLLGVGAPAEGVAYPWAVYRWIEGESLLDSPGADRDEVAVRLGRFVAALQRVDLEGGPASFRGGPVGALDARVRGEIRELGSDGSVDADRASVVWESALAAPAWDRPPVWVHADLYPGNLLVRGGRLSAVIDFGGLGMGDPACDLLPAWALLTARGRDLFRTEVGVDDATWVRGRGWGLALGLGAALFFRDTDPALAAVGRHAVAEAIADHEHGG